MTTNTGMEEAQNADGWPGEGRPAADGPIATLSNGATIEAVARHRNGVSGVGFSVAIVDSLFGKSCKELSGRRFLVITFDSSPAHTAVLDLDDLADSDIEFGTNSWRGDVAADICRDAILSLV